MSTAPVQSVGSQAGSQGIDPIAEASGHWRVGLEASLTSARMDGSINPNLVRQAGYQSLVAPTASGVALGDLPPDVALEIVEARGKAMNEFLKSWGDGIIEQAKLSMQSATRAQKEAALQKAQRTANMLEAMGHEALERARADVRGTSRTTAQTTTARPASRNQPAGVGAANETLLAGSGAPGAGGALSAPSGGNLGVVTGRKNQFT